MKNQRDNRKGSGIDAKGFTLLEMLIVSAILSVVALAIYASLNNGIKIWQMVNKTLPEEDLNIFFDKFSLDIRNAFKFAGINFLGTKDALEFPTLVNSPRLQKRTVGKVIYTYVPRNRMLNRYQVDFDGVYSGETDRGLLQSLKNVTSLNFQYYFYDKERKEYLWQDEWLKGGLPLAIKVEMEFDNGRETKKFAKTVGIPSGS
ncbi:MAG: prepilin-type N-terminal cleavage/methylation domain-containing protein [Candidatus Omnitrophica bacterium]|nr:prepilin-type N-terminal cleavage/methylation domain-containing protein [Candidatus Omnitrophota bacterium]